ncbi:hypothetical protein J4558_15635 [Leptolyngbya sp. 15MV]|nr:hypothetical protein J4558_15635 [Leptolyngbya sp. 15MV]
MGSLAHLWQRLETAPADAAPHTEWRALCGDDFGSIEGLLEANGRRASVVTSPRLNAPDMRVVVHKNGTVAAVCDHGVTPRREVAPEEYTLLHLSPKRMRLAIASALALETSTTPINGLPGEFRIGTWGVAGSDRFPVAFVAQTDVLALATTIRSVVSSSDIGMIVMTPTADGWSDELREWVEARKSVLVTAEDALEASDTGLVASGLWLGFLDRFARRIGLDRTAPRRSKPKRKKRADRLGAINAVEKALTGLAKDRVSLIRTRLRDEQGMPTGLPRVTKAAIATAAKVKPHVVTRVLQDADAKSVLSLFALVNDPQALWDSGLGRVRLDR